MCARTGAQVDIGQEGSLAWVRITATQPRAAESMLWEVVAVVPDSEACAVGIALAAVAPGQLAPGQPSPTSPSTQVLEAARTASERPSTLKWRFDLQ